MKLREDPRVVSLINSDTNKLSKPEDPNLNFNVVKNSMDELKGYLIEMIRADDKKDLSSGLRAQIVTLVSEWVAFFGRIANYDVIKDQREFKGNIRKDIINAIDAWYNDTISGKNNFLTIYNLVTAPHDLNERSEILLGDLSRLLDESKKEIADLKYEKTSLQGELETFQERYKDTFTKAELNKQYRLHGEYADANKIRAYWWLVGIFFAFLVLAFTLYYFFKCFCFDYACITKVICDDCHKPILYLEIFKAVSYRLFIISIIVYIISFCVRNYNASMHNFTINLHRASSIEAALRLVERAKTEEGNDNIIAQAINAIFSHQPTGYNNKDPENIISTLTEKIIEKTKP